MMSAAKVSIAGSTGRAGAMAEKRTNSQKATYADDGLYRPRPPSTEPEHRVLWPPWP